MRIVSPGTRYRRDVKRLGRRGYDIEQLTLLTEIIQREGRPPARCRPHALSGNWAGYMECHVTPDWLLIYQVDDRQVRLFRTGRHSDLFR